MKNGKDAKRQARSKRTERPFEVFPRLVSFIGQEKTYRIHLLKLHWPDIVGEAVACHVRPVRMDFKKLFLAADAPVWANEFHYMERKIIDRINSFVCDELVTEIVFCSPRSEYFARKAREREAPEETLVIPGGDEIAASEMMVAKAKVKNDEVRKAAARAFAQNLALRRARAEDGWRPCADCGRLVSPNESLCPFCARKKREASGAAVRSLLLREPWLHVREILDILDCSREIVRREREDLLRSLAARVRQGDESGDDAKRLVMLYASVKPEGLTEEIVKKYMARLRYDLLWEGEETDKNGKRRKARGNRSSGRGE
ncbi:MAG: DUF721 domain-containing protein [Schwartzia sp.]|nr:DUF721 domain-containing protein [Schwartzia sp. (in: firmicutes)]